jgi:hypothetical protein
MDVRPQKFGAWSGIACVVIFLTGFWIVAGFIPPPAPSATAAEIGAFYREHQTRILIGMVIAMIGAGFTGPWVAAITSQLRRIEGWSVLVLTQFAMGALLVLEFILFIMFWEVAAFRPERSDESIQMINDLGWIPFIGLTSTAIIQACVIAAIILRDKSPVPVLPRWSAFFNIWVGLAFVPGSWNCLFKTGPIAWNGVFSFYIAMVAFMTWYLVNSYVVLRATKRQEQEALAGDSSAPPDATHSLERLAAEVAELREQIARDRPVTR